MLTVRHLPQPLRNQMSVCARTTRVEGGPEASKGRTWLEQENQGGLHAETIPCTVCTSSNRRFAARSGFTAHAPTDAGAASFIRLSLEVLRRMETCNLLQQLNLQPARRVCPGWPGRHRAPASPVCFLVRRRAALYLLKTSIPRAMAPRLLSVAHLDPTWQITLVHQSSLVQDQRVQHLLEAQSSCEELIP
jgi:hypothetical protein